jgi:hypothetical protein
MPDGGYPYGDVAKALEQNGWLKSEITRKVDKEDLLKLENRLKSYSHELEEQRLKQTNQSLTNWWAHEKPEIAKMIRKAIKEDRSERDEIRKQVLAEQGLEVGPDGKVKSKVNPVKAFIQNNWFVVVVGVAVIVITNPDMAFDGARWLGALFF